MIMAISRGNRCRDIIKRVAPAILAALSLAAPATLEAQPLNTTGKPNVLFLFADDQRADTIAAHGNQHIKTPNLDRLAASGFSFRNNYIFGGNSGPSASRAGRC